MHQSILDPLSKKKSATKFNIDKASYVPKTAWVSIDTEKDVRNKVTKKIVLVVENS